MSEKVIQLFTYKSVETILATGGTQSWAVDRARAKACKYAVCCRNAYNRDTEGNEAHGSAFMIGLISDVVPSTETKGRWLVKFSKYALVNVGDQWEGRNPVRFYSVEDYKNHIDFENQEWKDMPEPSGETDDRQTMRLTIGEAKLALAAAFRMHPSAIEIVV